jgi:hypothetical protein
LVFSLGQAPFLMKHATETEPSEGPSNA